jgi:hypothetical protein
MTMTHVVHAPKEVTSLENDTYSIGIGFAVPVPSELEQSIAEAVAQHKDREVVVDVKGSDLRIKFRSSGGSSLKLWWRRESYIQVMSGEISIRIELSQD